MRPTGATGLEGAQRVRERLARERRGGVVRDVTLLARQYTVHGERRSVALLCPIGDFDSQEHVRDAILKAFALN